jgi:peptidyl-prolyl cis-trans isomerase B (cyclophilin B)
VLKKILAIAVSASLMTGIGIAQEKEKAVEKPKAEVKNPIVEIQTNQGNIYLEVFANETPIHAGNFLAKVDGHKYDGLTFHRVVKGFVIQGGDPSGTGSGSMGEERLADETSPYPQARGTVAMARSQAGASNCQFYINLKDNSFLDKQKFSSFARVIGGMDVVDKIANVPVGPNDKPNDKVIMTKLHRVEKVPTSPAPKTEGK